MARILIVDDQKSVLLMLESILSKHNHYVVSASGPIEATDKLKKEHFDMIITDAVMPDITGFAFVKALRLDSRFSKIAVLMLTGKREKKDVQQSLEVGVDDYMIKPVDPDLLLAKINSLISKKSTAPTEFFSCPVLEPAKWLGDTKIVSISELGVTIVSSIHVPVGFKVQVESDLFNSIKMDTPTLRVTACEVQETNKSLFTIHAQFVGLSEKDLQPLRVWLFNASKSKSA